LAIGPRSNSRLGKAVAALISCALLAACARASSPALHGTAYVPPRPAPEFALPSTVGRTFDLAKARGHLVVLYFGFTHCADVCPQTLAHVDAAIRAAQTPAVRLVFASIDPRRDSIAAERAFFARAAVRAIGVTGTAAQLAPVWKAYGVSIAPQLHDIAHSDYLYLIDPNGSLREVLHADVPIADLTADLRALAS
jgi:protein SCO1/2